MWVSVCGDDHCDPLCFVSFIAAAAGAVTSHLVVSFISVDAAAHLSAVLYRRRSSTAGKLLYSI